MPSGHKCAYKIEFRTFDAQVETVRGVSSVVDSSAQILAGIAHFDLRDGQIPVRVEVDTGVCGDSLPVFVPEHLGLGIALGEALERDWVVFKDAYVLLTNAEIRRNCRRKEENSGPAVQDQSSEIPKQHFTRSADREPC